MCVREPGAATSKPSSSSPVAIPHRKARRSSIFDEDGNEIVLGSPISAGNVIPESAADDSKEGEDEFEHVQTKTKTRQPKPKFLSRGGSSIVSPYGQVLAGPQWEDDRGIIYADVDLEDCVRGRLDLDAAGSYSR